MEEAVESDFLPNFPVRDVYVRLCDCMYSVLLLVSVIIIASTIWIPSSHSGWSLIGWSLLFCGVGFGQFAGIRTRQRQSKVVQNIICSRRPLCGKLLGELLGIQDPAMLEVAERGRTILAADYAEYLEIEFNPALIYPDDDLELLFGKTAIELDIPSNLARELFDIDVETEGVPDTLLMGLFEVQTFRQLFDVILAVEQKLLKKPRTII